MSKLTLTHAARLFPREGGDPVWAPAYAGEQGAGDNGKLELATALSHACYHPGEGRGPVGKRS